MWHLFEKEVEILGNSVVPNEQKQKQIYYRLTKGR